MPFYSLCVKSLVDILANYCSKPGSMQKWYADDSSAVGKLIIVKEWWLKLIEMRPKFSYFPESSKYILVLKDFADTEIEITCQGQRHLGAGCE